MNILNSPLPGDALMANRDCWPLYLDLGLELSAGPTPFHSGSILQHLCRCMNECAGDPLAVWMALAHDAGKLTTPLAMLPHHYGHELRGKILARIWARQLGLDENFSSAGQKCALLHMRAGRYVDMRPGKQYALLDEVNSLPLADSFWRVVDADTRCKVSGLAREDWKLIQDARARGLGRDMQLQELSRLGAGSRERRRRRALKKEADRETLEKGRE